MLKKQLNEPEALQELRAICSNGACRYYWLVACLPMAPERVARLQKYAACPKCGTGEPRHLFPGPQRNDFRYDHQWDAWTQTEVEPYFRIAQRWLNARTDKDYVEADRLRALLTAAGVLIKDVVPGFKGLTFCIFREALEHRMARIDRLRNVGDSKPLDGNNA